LNFSIRLSKRKFKDKTVLVSSIEFARKLTYFRQSPSAGQKKLPKEWTGEEERKEKCPLLGIL